MNDLDFIKFPVIAIFQQESNVVIAEFEEKMTAKIIYSTHPHFTEGTVEVNLNVLDSDIWRIIHWG